MEAKKEIIFEPLAGGFAWVTGGGTRQEIKLSRPWQEPLENLIIPDKCPFCTKPQEELPLPGIPAEWRLLPNPFTPHLRHRLIGPKRCWPSEKMRMLGGREAIAEALEIARIATAQDDVEMATFIHVGRSAGQNLGHPHWHLMQARVRGAFPIPFAFPLSRLIADRENFVIVAGGVHSGECLVAPKRPLSFIPETISRLAECLSWLIELCNVKFRSNDRSLPPDFIVTYGLATAIGCGTQITALFLVFGVVRSV